MKVGTTILSSLFCIVLGFSIQYVINNDINNIINVLTSSKRSPCGEYEQNNLIISPSFKERVNGKLETATIRKASNIFRKCGAVAINEAASITTIDDFRKHLNHMISPLLESRERVQKDSRLKKTWDELSQQTKEELFLSSGEAIRERQNGRLDLLLPHTMPFNNTDIILNKFSMGILKEIFNQQTFELKSVHGVISLPETTSQKWHRDDGPLFPTASNDRYVEEYQSSTNVYAVNAFIALNDIKLNQGPTEYMLGSHLETNEKMQSVIKDEHQAVAFEWPKGSLVLMDYRTVHRGGANLDKTSSRVLAMLVYGRPWWRDAVNYMGDNYGGLDRTPELFTRNENKDKVDVGDARVVSRRLLQRQVNDPVKQEMQRKSMYEYCRMLWKK